MLLYIISKLIILYIFNKKFYFNYLHIFKLVTIDNNSLNMEIIKKFVIFKIYILVYLK